MSAIGDVAALLDRLEQLPDAAPIARELRGAIATALGEEADAIRANADAYRNALVTAADRRHRNAVVTLRRRPPSGT